MLPLRTAIRSRASTEVIDALIRAAPSVVKSFGVSGKASHFDQEKSLNDVFYPQQ